MQGGWSSEKREILLDGNLITSGRLRSPLFDDLQKWLFGHREKWSQLLYRKGAANRLIHNLFAAGMSSRNQRTT
ncbi:hypothetical protein RvY_13204 [Ramazzottius varieornatus]|uniref:Uncharacterized protein n=1 Tax=Ramazzottius varieornatus TaxID=947166 RepID=A0A1D1VSG6_RAMVA|nr:hypothetical protein RvY_13204 [Ramazzottius varieornatus]